MLASLIPTAVDGLFGGPEVLVAPSIAERAAYKKEGGSSDTNHTTDEIKD